MWWRGSAGAISDTVTRAIGVQKRGPNPSLREGLEQGIRVQQGWLLLGQNGSRLLALGMKTAPKHVCVRVFLRSEE